MSCTKKKACISQESDIDIRLGLFLVVQAKKYAYPRNPIPAVAQQEGWSTGFRENLPVPKEKQQFPSSSSLQQDLLAQLDTALL